MVSELNKFLRIRLLPSVWADIAAGAALTSCFAGHVDSAKSSGTAMFNHLLPFLIISSCLYLFGMATNSIFDYKEDKKRFPSRPLPSGRLKFKYAWGSALFFLAAATGVSIMISWTARLIMIALLSTILLYNLGGKKLFILGPVLMGSCRSLNLLLGALSPHQAGFSVSISKALIPALIIGGYVCLVTWTNTLEGRQVSRKKIIWLGFTLLLFPPALVLQPEANHISLLPLVTLSILIPASFPWKGLHNKHINEKPVHMLLYGIYFFDSFFMAQAGALLLSGFCSLAGILLFLITFRFRLTRTA